MDKFGRHLDHNYHRHLGITDDTVLYYELWYPLISDNYGMPDLMLRTVNNEEYFKCKIKFGIITYVEIDGVKPDIIRFNGKIVSNLVGLVIKYGDIFTFELNEIPSEFYRTYIHLLCKCPISREDHSVFYFEK